jgi:hypothetical protein
MSQRKRTRAEVVAEELFRLPWKEPGIPGYDDQKTIVTQRIGAAVESAQIGLGIALGRISINLNRCVMTPDLKIVASVGDGAGGVLDLTCENLRHVVDDELRWRLLCIAVEHGMPGTPNLPLFLSVVQFMQAVVSAMRIIKRNKKIREAMSSSASCFVEGLL